MKVALIQFCSQNNKAENLFRLSSLIEKAASNGAEVVVLPEMFSFMGSDAGSGDPGDALGSGSFEFLSQAALQNRVFVVGGSCRESVATDGLRLPLETKVYNTHQTFGPDGEAVFTYRKQHLFNLKSSDGVLEFRESDSFLPGGPPENLFDMTCGDRVWKALTLICYDLRFPEIFRMQNFRTTPPEVVFLPSAFTHRTGKAHWEVLVRARAIENQCYMVACNQTGYFDGGLKRNYGHSMVVSPWGEVILDMGDPEGIGMVDLGHEDVFRCRDQLPALRNRVL